MNGGRVRVLRYLVVVAAAVLGAFAFAQPASATTFCVPAFYADCPSGGGNVETNSLPNALSQDGSDGTPDIVHIDVSSFTPSSSIKAIGSDDLTILGSGRDKTVISSSSSSNIYVLQLNSRTGSVTMKDLSVVVPASFPDSGGNGAALQAGDVDLESVDFVTENDGSDAVANIIGGGNFEDVHILGRNGASFSRGIDGGLCSPGVLSVTNSDIVTEGSGIVSDCPNRPISVDRTEISSVSSALSIANGGTLEATNTIIRGGDYSPIQMYNNSGDATNVKLDHLTVLALGDNTVPGFSAVVPSSSAATADINLQISNSIITGFQKSWKLEAPTDPARGNVNALISYSNFLPEGEVSGDAILGQGEGNLNETPGFVDITDFHLSQSSPMVDAGDPTAVAPELDFEGNARPIDGDYDGTAIRDIGAYELNPPPPSCPIDPSKCPDTTRPKVSKVKFRFKRGKGGAIRMVLSEQARVRVALVPLPKGKDKRKKVVIVRNKANAGPLTLKLGKRRLGPGRYRLAIAAVDTAGNRSQLVVRRVKAKR